MIAPENPNYESRGNCLIDIAMSEVMFGNEYSEIPKGIKSIGDYAFYGAQIKRITIPDGVERIGMGAFNDCSNLLTIFIPDSVSYIGNYAFFFCYTLKNVHYYGSQEQWDAIEIGADNENLTELKINVNYVQSTN